MNRAQWTIQSSRYISVDFSIVPRSILSAFHVKNLVTTRSMGMLYIVDSLVEITGADMPARSIFLTRHLDPALTRPSVCKYLHILSPTFLASSTRFLLSNFYCTRDAYLTGRGRNLWHGTVIVFF